MVVGRGLAGEEGELARAVPNVDVLGWTEPAQLPRLFAGAAVALVPWADTPANRARNSAKVLELMASGRPIVAYAVGELPFMLGPEGALLVPPGNEAEFVSGIIALLADPARAARLGQVAQARVRREFAWDRLASGALRAYALAGQGRS